MERQFCGEDLTVTIGPSTIPKRSGANSFPIMSNLQLTVQPIYTGTIASPIISSVGKRATRLPAAKINAGCVIVPGGRQPPPSSSLLASIFSHRQVVPRFSGAGLPRQPGFRPATRQTLPAAQDASKNRVALCLLRVSSNKKQGGKLFPALFAYITLIAFPLKTLRYGARPPGEGEKLSSPESC